MPKINYLNELAAYNQRHGITATFSEMKKTARRLDKLAAEQEQPVDIEAYFLDYSDEVGEEATDNVMTERAHHASIVRRLAA